MKQPDFYPAALFYARFLTKRTSPQAVAVGQTVYGLALFFCHLFWQISLIAVLS